MDSENGSVSFDAQLIYYPSSTSVHKTLTFTDHVYFDYANDAEGDWDQLPADFDRTATVGYTETTDYNGTVTRSDFAVEDGDGLDNVTDAQIAGWTVAGYTNNADLGNFITDDGMVGLLEQSNGDTQSANTLITYSAAEVALTVTYVDDADNGAVVGETTTLTGLTGSTGTYHATAPDKYVLAKTQSSAVDYTVTPDNSDNITVHLTHAITHTTATTTRTVNYTIEGQSSTKAPASVTQTTTWNVATDEVTGNAVYTPQSGYAVVQSPTIDGYTADGDVAAISFAATTTAPASATTATVNYTANAETLTVHYVDDVTGAEVSTNTVAGNMDGTGTYTVVTPAHYGLADGQSSSVTYTLTNDDTDDITVHLTHAVAHTTDTTTRTINYVIVDGDQSKTPAATVQTVTWAVTTDEVTGTSYATAQNTYGAVTSPSVMGYTADGNVAAEVLAPTLTERLENTTTTVTYRADAASLTVHYVDDVTGEQVTSATLKGVTDGTGTYQVTVPAKYALADDQADSFGYTFAADNNDDVTVHLTHAIAYGTTTTTRTINYVLNGNADKNPASVTQTLTWSTATDEVTGAVVATPQGEYAAVKSPTVHGYTADGDVSAATVATMAATPVNAQDVTVTYSANPASLTVHYVDDVTGEQVTSATLTGVTDESGTYKVQAPTHFVLADGQGAEVDYTFATDDNDDVTVHLTHAVVHTTTTTTRTINYVVTGHADKNPATVTQTLTWNVATDEVTGTAVATPQGGYAAVTSPTVHGYTANGNVTAYNVAATTDTPVNAHNVTVTYTANPATLTVHYVDDVTGEQVTSTTLVGVTDESGTYNVQTPAHYVLADGQVAEVDYTFGTTDADDVTVHLTHAIAHTTATTTRTINYVVDGNSSKNPASVTQSLTWNVATDEVTGAVAATPQGEYAAVISPTVNGYTADGNVDAAIVTATNAMPVNAADVTVTYTANPAGLTVHYVDDVTGEQVTSATLTGVTDESGTYSVQTPTHYVLAEGQASEFDYTFATNDNDNVTVHLTHAIAHTTATTTRTINYAFADGDATKAPTTAIQTITWNVVTDEVTGASYATPTGEYGQVDSPAVTGYTADRNVNAEALAPTTTTRLANTSTTVTYHANAADLTVTYVDDVTGQTVTTHTLTGTTDATGTYTVAAPAHYVLADGQSRSINYTFAADNSDAVTVHLTHAVEHSTATTTRTINFVVDDGDTTKAPRPVVQTVTWNVATDAVTGASVATATGTYAGVDAPTVAGYTADGNVAAQTLGAVDTADLADSQVTVHYTANDAELTVTYVDDVTGDTVTTAKLTGKTDGTGTYAVTTPAHYALADGQSGSVNYTFAADDSDNVTVHLTHAVAHSTATTTRTINYVVSGGDTAKAPASVVQTVTWNVTTDAVTGASYATAQEAYGAVSAPEVAGYTADHGTDAQVMGPVAVEALADTTTTVTYTPNDADITVTYVDDTDGTTVESQTLIGQVDGTGTYTVTVPGGYQLADGQSRSINYVFATDASDNMTVHLAHHVTAGTATTTRTINYVVDGGGTTGPTSVIQTVVFATSTDDVTGLTTATAAGNYAAVATPTVAGYTADTARVTAATPQYADGDAVVTVHYAANAEQLTVRYVDDVTGTTGTTLSTDTITGTMNQSGVYTVTVPANYALADGQSRAVNYRLTDDDSDDVTVHLTHAMQYGDATTTRTINYVTADGKAGVAPANVTQVAHWRVVTDLATGGSIATATDGYAAVASPTLAGYTTSGNVAAVELGATNTAALQDTSVTVTYTAVAQPDNGGTTTPPATTPDNGGTPTAPVTAPVTTPSGTTTTTATVPVVPNVVATPTTPAVTPTTTTPVAPAVQAGSSTPATPLVAMNTATPISAAGVTPDVASMAANIEREAAATSVASTADAAERDVTANVGADITDALNANSTDAVAQRAVTPAGVTATILNVGEQSQNRIPGGSSESTYTYFAQKIADAQTQEAVQYELLLRQWDSGVNNWVLPSSFGITVGMQTTLMQQALRSLDSGNISINLTTSQFTDDTVVQRLSSFARNRQGQGTLTIELAELPSAAQLASVMPTYHDGGVKVVLGDAQDADSSDAARVASQLDGFKFALQKLRARGEDQQWVSAAHQWQALARDTGGTFTLEGVESDGDLQVARQMGITNVQGFLFGKPAQPTQIDFE